MGWLKDIAGGAGMGFLGSGFNPWGAAIGAGLGLLGGGGDDTETTTQRRQVPSPSINEQQLLIDLMQLYNNPYQSMDAARAALEGVDLEGNPVEGGKLDPSTPFGSMVYYYDKMEKAMDIYEALPGKYGEEKEKYTRELDLIANDLGTEKTRFFNTLGRLSKQSSRDTKGYKQELSELRQTRGIPVSFGGQPMGEMLPFRKMGMMADLAGKGYGASMTDIGTRSGLAGQKFGGAGGFAGFLSGQAGQKYGAAKDVLAAEERMPGYTTALAKDWYNTQRGGAADLWKTMLTARHGVPSTTTEQPTSTWWQRMMPMMMYQYGNQGKQSMQGVNPYSGYLDSLWPGY